MSAKVQRGICLGLLAIVSAELNLSLSAREGTLAMPPIYDDANYLLDGYLRVLRGDATSLFNLVASIIADPPHAPLSTLTSMLGYSLLGPHVWAPYFVSTWIVLVFLASVYYVARSALDPLPSILLAACTLFIPVVQFITTEFRPDFGASVLFALSLYLLISTDYRGISLRRAIVTAMVAAAAITAKPSVFMITLPVTALAALIGILRPGLVPRKEFWPSVRAARLPLVLFVIAFVPCVILFSPRAVSYAYRILIVDRHIWATEGDPLYHWTFNSIGRNGGAHALRGFFFVGLVAVVVDAALSRKIWREPQAYRALAYYFVVVVLYCLMSISTEQTFFISSLFFFPFIFAMVLALARLLRRLADQLPKADVVVAISLVVITAFASPAARISQLSRNFPNAGRMLDGITAVIAREAAGKPGCSLPQPVISMLTPYPVTPETTMLFAGLNYGMAIRGYGLAGARTQEEMVERALKSDFVLAPNKWGSEMHTNLPGVPFIEATKARLAADPTWKIVPIDAPDPPTLYVRKSCS